MSRGERDARNRLALIEAAEAIFVERGIDGASAALLVNPLLTSQERFEGWIAQWITVFRSGTRTQFARLLFELVPYALRDPDLMIRFAAIVSPGHDTVETAGPDDAEPQLPSPIPPGSAFAALPGNDQQRILSALDLGLAFQSLILPTATDPELYGTALRLLTSAPARTRSVDGEL